MDPTNPVAQVFYLRAGVHPAKAPLPAEPEPRWKPPEPDIAAHFHNRKATDIEKWFQS